MQKDESIILVYLMRIREEIYKYVYILHRGNAYGENFQ